MQPMIHEDIVKLQERGILTIPRSIRTVMGLEKNSLIRIRQDRSRLILEPVRVLPYLARSYRSDDLEEFFELDAKESKTLKEKGLL